MGAAVGRVRRWSVGLFVVAVVGGLSALPAAASTRTGVAEPCAEAQALENLGRPTAAEAVYLQELAKPASLGCAVAGLERLGRIDESCSYAGALAHDGARQAAHAAYVEVLSVDPSSACANHGVAATIAPSTTSIWTTAGNIAKDAGYAIGAILLAALLVVVAVLLWLEVQTRIPWLRDQWPAKKIRRPVFEVQALTETGTDPPLGPAVAGLIRGRVTWRTDRFGLNLVSGQAGVATAFSGLGDVSSEAKAAVAVITFLTALLPRRHFQLSGQLQPAGDEGVGVSLELSQNGDAEALVSLWATSFHLTDVPNVNAYQQLAVASAAWVDIWMTKALDGDALLTGDPQSWAFFRSGVDAQRLGEPVRARALYEQALAADGTNIGAMANLGIIHRRARDYEDAKDYLTRARRAIRDPATAPNLKPEENPDWYRIEYQLAALYTNWAADTEGEPEKSDRATLSGVGAKSLARKTLKVIIRLTKGGRDQGAASTSYLQTTLRPFLEGTIEPSVLTLLASTVSPLPAPPAGWPGDHADREAISASLEKEVDPWQLIAYVETGPNRPPETQFNLACFYTRAEYLATASKRLLRAVRETQLQERGRLVDVATTDPVLRPLMQNRPGLKAKLNAMLTDDKPSPEEAALIGHFERQDRTISHFRAQGWTVAWSVDTEGIDLTGARASERQLIRLLGLDRAGDTLDALYGIVQFFQKQHPDEDVKASMILPDDHYPTPDLNAARERGVEILKDTGHGFECLNGAAPGGAAAAPETREQQRRPSP